MILKFNLVISFIAGLLINSYCQDNSNLELFTEQKWKAEEIQDKIDTLSLQLKKSFLTQINNPETDAHKKLQEIFNDYKINHDNETNIYPEKIEIEHLSTHLLDYGDSYGWEGQNQDSVYYITYLTIIISIPAIENVYKSTFLSTINFKVNYRELTKSNLILDEKYFDEKLIESIELIELK